MNGARIPEPDGRFSVRCFDPLVDPASRPHTLIVGTMPSISSHGQAAYYAHASNAFWWIVGEALGFRRGGPRADAEWPDQFPTKAAKDIIAGLKKLDAVVLTYEDQVEALLSHGYILWDILKSCNIRNSDDTSITDYVPNDIPGLLAEFPTVRRIVFSSGKTSATLFAKMNRDWLRSRPFLLGRTEFSRAVFGRLVSSAPSDLLPLPSAAKAKTIVELAAPVNPDENVGQHVRGNGRLLPPIELIVPLSVSPAGSSSLRFPVKRDHWLEHVFLDHT